jgi:hypothetical protein
VHGPLTARLEFPDLIFSISQIVWNAESRFRQTSPIGRLSFESHYSRTKASSDFQSQIILESADRLRTPQIDCSGPQFGGARLTGSYYNRRLAFFWYPRRSFFCGCSRGIFPEPGIFSLQFESLYQRECAHASSRRVASKLCRSTLEQLGRRTQINYA